MSAEEINFDGLVGPTHNYAGLAEGNLAATRNKDQSSNPCAAALQGLAKMRRMCALGFTQGVLAPQERPNIPFLRSLGFSGSDTQIWEAAWKTTPNLARAAVSASSMWAANAATISPSFDTDGRVHITPANLLTMLHRALEADGTTRLLRAMFPEGAHFTVHEPLPAHADFADEGAANHMRMCASAGTPGVEIFVFGREAGESTHSFPARQTRAAAEAIARRHALDPKRTVLLRQAKRTIEAGAFHNDVVAVAHEHMLFHHEAAFEDTQAAYAAIRAGASGLFEPEFVEVKESDVPLAEAITSYLFNAQLVRSPGAAKLTLIAPTETRDANRAGPHVAQLVASGVLGGAEYVEVRESMRNGGGPACLRLRVVLTDAERAAMTPGFLLDDALTNQLEAWVRAHYRDSLRPEDLRDSALINETRRALDELTQILPLGGAFYPFQR